MTINGGLKTSDHSVADMAVARKLGNAGAGLAQCRTARRHDACHGQLWWEGFPAAEEWCESAKTSRSSSAISLLRRTRFSLTHQLPLLVAVASCRTCSRTRNDVAGGRASGACGIFLCPMIALWGPPARIRVSIGCQDRLCRLSLNRHETKSSTTTGSKFQRSMLLSNWACLRVFEATKTRFLGQYLP
jgi:hypothetical protein